MTIARLESDNWIDRCDRPLTIPNPIWEQVEKAIWRLNDYRHSTVVLALDGSDSRYMMVAGRLNDRCMVNTTDDNHDFYSLVDPTQPEGTVLLDVGGQGGDYKLTRLVPVDWAIEAAKEYYVSGTRKAALNWVSDY